MASHEARAEALSNDDPSISIPFTPRDEDNDIHKDNIVDLADFLKDTSPPTQQQRRFSRPATTTKGPRKLRKKSLRASVPVQDISLEGFTPKGVEERVSKDGKKYFVIVAQHIHDTQTSDQYTIGTSTYSTARSSVDMADKPTESSQALSQHPLPRPYSAGPAQTLAGEEDKIAPTRHRRRSSSVDGIRTFANVQERLSSTFRRQRSNAKDDHTLAKEAQRSSVEGNNDTSASSRTDRPNLPKLELKESAFSSNGAQAAQRRKDIDAHAALSSNPVNPSPAPAKPLPTPPRTTNFSRNDAYQPTRKAEQATNAADTHDHPSAPHKHVAGEERASNQGLKRTSHDKYAEALFAPINRGNDVRSLHAMSSFLRSTSRESGSSYHDIPESSGIDDVDPGQDAQQVAAQNQLTNTSSRSSLSERSYGSVQQKRKDVVRARMRRDIQKGRQSVDSDLGGGSRPSTRGSILAERRDSHNMLQDPIKEQEPRLEPSPVITSQTKGAENSDGLRISTIHPTTVTNLTNDDTPTIKSHIPKRDDLATLPTVAAESTDHFTTPKDEMPQPTFDAVETEPLPATAVPAIPKINGAQAQETGHGYLSDPPQHPIPAPPKSPAYSFVSNKSSATASANRVSTRQSQLLDPMARLQARVDLLERQNKLLEAALTAVLKTSGKLNGCPCGRPVNVPAEVQRAQSGATTRSIATPAATPQPETDGFAAPGLQEDVQGATDPTVARQSLLSNATLGVGAAEAQDMANGNAPGQKALDLYMRTRAVQKSLREAVV